MTTWYLLFTVCTSQACYLVRDDHFKIPYPTIEACDKAGRARVDGGIMYFSHLCLLEDEEAK